MCWSPSALCDASCLGCYCWPCSPSIPVSKECVNKHTNAWLAQDSTPRESMTGSLVYTLAQHCLLNYHPRRSTLHDLTTMSIDAWQGTRPDPTAPSWPGNAKHVALRLTDPHLRLRSRSATRSHANDTACLSRRRAAKDGWIRQHRPSKQDRSHGSRENPL